MNKTAMWVVLAIIVLGLIAFFAFGKKKAAAPDQSVQSNSQSANTQQPVANSTAQPQSLKELMAGSGSTKCTFSDTGSVGTFYVSGGKARGDFSTTSGTQITMSHMILDATTSYVWVDGQKQGFKMMIDAQTQSSAQVPQGSVDANKKMNYNCSAWTADSSMFQMPASVQFMDMNSFKAGM